MEGVDYVGMIGILDYAIIRGRHVRTVEEIASFYDAETHKQMREIGLSQIPTDNLRPLSDMISEAYNMIHQKPDCVLIAHSLPFISKTNEHFLCDNIPVFRLSGMPCAIMHKATEVACKLIQAGIYKTVLVIGADKAYSDTERVFFGTIMGDAVVAILLGESTHSSLILANEISTTVIAPDGENSSEEDILRFRKSNATLMRNAIFRCLEKGGIIGVDYFVTHTSNRKFWDVLATMIKYPREKFLDSNIRNTGHMNSHDSFLHYFYFFEQKVICKGDIVMLINPGFGGTQGCTLIKA